MKDWFKLYATTNQAEASIIKGMLEENNVPVFIMNKQDSSYLNFGEVEVYVPHNLKEIAQSLLNKTLMN
ncbi:MAG TPA: DUF2007 domain-containing protein [Segetibacter sp.]|jgi:hypothetical protein